MSRNAITIAALAVIVSLAGIVFNFIRNPYADNREALEERLAEAAVPSGAFDSQFEADYEAWKKSVDDRAPLWDALTPPPEKKAAPPDPAKEMEGIKLLPGSSGSGASARVRLSTPDRPRGQMFKVGEAVKGNVTLKEVTPDKVIFDVKVGATVVPFTMAR